MLRCIRYIFLFLPILSLTCQSRSLPLKLQVKFNSFTGLVKFTRDLYIGKICGRFQVAFYIIDGVERISLSRNMDSLT